MGAAKITIGFIGAGELATFAHFPSLVEMDDVELAAVCDLDENCCRQASENFGFKAAYRDYHEMLDREKPGAVFTALMPQHIFPVAADVLRRGIPLFLEKPPGMTSYQTGCLAAIAGEKGVMSFVGFNRRYAPTLLEARSRIERHGPVDHFVVTFSKYGGQDKRPYYDGIMDILMFDAIHAVDLVRWLGGEPEAASAVTRVSHTDQDAKYVALLRFAGGKTGFLNCVWTSGTRTLAAELHGGGACAFVDIEKEVRFHFEGAAAETVSAAKLAGGDAAHRVRGYFNEDRAFIECVKSGKRPANDLADALKTMQLAERLYYESL